MFEKLTYSGTECNNRLYFAFDGEYFNPETITARLGINPTSVKIKKDPVPKSTSWKYKIIAGKELDLEAFLEKLIDVFEPKVEDIMSLKEDLKLNTRIQFVIDIDIDPEASTPFFGLNKRTIDFLSATGTEVQYEVYKVDSMDLLRKIKKK